MTLLRFGKRLFISLIAACLVAGAAFSQKNDDDFLKVESSLVVLNVIVTDSEGKPVRGLKQSQFTVLEDGKPQTQSVQFFGKEETPFAAAILIDSSGSMEAQTDSGTIDRVRLARASATNFVDGLRGDDVFAIYNFDSTVKQVQEFSKDRFISESFYRLKASGDTVLNDAIYKAAEDLSKRPEKRRAIIVLSDGADTRSGKSVDKALKMVSSASAVIYAVDMAAGNGIGHAQGVGALKNLAEKSGGKFISAENGLKLRDAFKQIVSELGEQYTIAYQPSSEPDGKWHSIEVRIAKPNLQIRTRKGYQSPKK